MHTEVVHASITQTASRDVHYATLMAHAHNTPNNHLLACMIASWLVGQGNMPTRFGLSETSWNNLLNNHFPHYIFPQRLLPSDTIDVLRLPECDELRTLFFSHCDTITHDKQCLADILITGCMGSDHLWQDLGLWSRKDLTTLMKHNFPSLAAKNDRDMKWKKFFYKQLCLQEGIYICRAPSCEVCADYQKCFGSEE
ncbi:nitrogen fixation protein NifQ [Beggiatoa leptomitoformis]|uniref:Nitrogen fixation protein NifQ n=1 Tax=Beggiatoa leptomitoformis TaxID=288004 RepID=A0A2N9YDP7_9GAMM|nr:nitrogen fixation protein NifQ [Beggiatoa leptomitoformis]ALG68992.1 nitrogen fixation protein NifQ [Beggiatoa leptomitoformis]AUI68613.1 nitrogen fixation protein NifQ [Beggiatoa leptomitoformis]